MTISLIKTSLNYTFSKVSSINRPLTWDLKALYALDNKAWRDTFVIFLLAFCCKKHTIKLMIFMHAKLPDLCRYTVFFCDPLFYYVKRSRCLKITEKVSFNIESEASYVYILSRQKLIKNAKNGSFWRVFENLKLAVKQCYQTGQFW